MKDLGIDQLDANQRIALAIEIWESLGQSRPTTELTPEQTNELAPTRCRIGQEPTHRPDVARNPSRCGVHTVSLPLEFHPAVCNEVEIAHDWYEQQKETLGKDFLNEVQRVLDEIAGNPARFGFAIAYIREGVLTHFPDAIDDRELADRIRILAIHHASRDPSGWYSRS